MKSFLVVICVLCACLSVPVSAADSTHLFLHSNVVRVGDTAISLVFMAKNNYALDIAAMQNIVRFPKWLSISDLVVLKKDGSRNSEVISLPGKKYEQSGYTSQITVFASTAAVPKVKADSIPLLKLVLSINPSYKLTEGETIYLSADSIELSTFLAQSITCNQPISLALKALKKGATDTTVTDTTHTDTTKVDTVNSRLKLRLSIDKANPDEGYTYKEAEKKAEYNVYLESKVIVSNLSFVITAPDTNWKMLEPTIIGREKICLTNYLGDGRYKILYSGDTDDHPLLPNVDGKRRAILKLSFVPKATPFGPKRFNISAVSVASLYEAEKLSINKDTGVTSNLNNLFGVKIGMRGDLNFQEWIFGDGKRNSEDAVLMTDGIMERIKFNDYQNWAADLDSSGVVDVSDIVLLQKMILASDVDESIEALPETGADLIVHRGEIQVLVPNLVDAQLALYDVYGTRILETQEMKNISTEYISSGVYLYVIRGQAVTGREVLKTGKILIYK